MSVAKNIADEAGMQRTIERLASEIAEREDLSEAVFVGIKTRGVPLAQRIAAMLEEKTGKPIKVGQLDITFYRDDLTKVSEMPMVKGSHIPFQIEDKTVILCDDVLYTGRTVRAAMDELLDFGRFAALRLCVLVDRGWRELPICPDYTGFQVKTLGHEVVEVKFRETDGRDEIILMEG
ncbi:MAG: bifunctional pyr operon transcriptional regulator/uracil phosphoribosyltransferase PyrR [candidate division WOR-3 bacterium]